MSWYEMARRSKLCDLFDDDLPYMPSEDIERILSENEFDVAPYRASGREAARCVPIMSIAFHRMMVSKLEIPSLEEFLLEYEVSNQGFFDGLDDAGRDGVRYRAAKSYPSLIRDIHFVMKARELGASVRRTLRDDISGIDASIQTNDGNRHIRLYYDSPRSRRHRIIKAMVHDVSIDHVDMPLTQENATRVGNIFLYSTEAVHRLLDEIGALNGGSNNEQGIDQ